MNRRRLWLASVAALAGAVVFAGWLPGYRLDREIAAARADGMPTDMKDVRRRIAPVREGANAAPLIRAAVAADRAETDLERRSLDSATGSIVKEKSTPPEITWFRSALATKPERLERWRRAAERPGLDFQRPWEQGGATLFPEYATIKSGARRLVAAARLGIEPERNLLAAARLSALCGQEPDLIAQLVRASVGHLALREAKREGRARKVAAALGPPLDARWALTNEPATLLDSMRRIGEPGWETWMGLREPEGFWERIRHVGPIKANARLRVVRGWHTIWRELPRDGTDLEGAARVLDRRLPAVYREVGAYSDVLGQLMDVGDTRALGDPLRNLAKYERERSQVRNSGEPGAP